MRLGYACLNQTLRDLGMNKKKMLRSHFDKGGLEEVARISRHNIIYTKEVMKWNVENKIHLFRFTQILPWIDQYNLEDLPGWDIIAQELQSIGLISNELNQRLTVHPSEFCVVASPNSTSVDNSIRELNQVALMMDVMGLQRTPYNKINIHVGGVYGDKIETAKRFCEVIRTRGSDSLRSRLTIENDDRQNGFCVEDLYNLISTPLGIPIVFDSFHHGFCPGTLEHNQALELAKSTWPTDINPIVHLSSSRKLFEDDRSRASAHSDWIYTKLDNYGRDMDIMIEAKKTELAVLKYQSLLLS